MWPPIENVTVLNFVYFRSAVPFLRITCWGWMSEHWLSAHRWTPKSSSTVLLMSRFASELARDNVNVLSCVWLEGWAACQETGTFASSPGWRVRDACCGKELLVLSIPERRGALSRCVYPRVSPRDRLAFERLLQISPWSLSADLTNCSNTLVCMPGAQGANWLAPCPRLNLLERMEEWRSFVPSF